MDDTTDLEFPSISTEQFENDLLEYLGTALHFADVLAKRYARRNDKTLAILPERVLLNALNRVVEERNA